jgi:meiotic recombination protein SPO11
MSTYKHGSMNLAHETNLAVRSIQWLGVRSCDFLHQTEGDVQGLLKLTARDRKIALKLLEKQPSDGGGLNEDWGRELQIMLMLNVKVEIQILGGGEVLGEWLDSKLLHVSNSHISSNTP